MPLEDDRWRFIVETVLGVRREDCEALVARIAARHPAHERRAALARSFVPRATITGAPSGWSEVLSRTLGLSLIEERSIMGQRATLLASLGLLDDPRFFEREGWPKRALGISPDDSGAVFVLREGVRFALRLAVIRGAHRATRLLGRRGARLVGAVTGAAFNAFEQLAFNAYALEEHAAPHFDREHRARVIPLRRVDVPPPSTTEESS